MESRSYMFSTVKKKSTLLENKGIEYKSSNADFLEKILQHHACALSRKNVLPSMISTWTVLRKILEKLKTVLSFDRKCSTAESLVSKKPMLTLIIPID